VTWAALPEWMRSIRFRMTLLYSSVLFALAALLVGSVYLGLSLSLRGQPITRETSLTEVVRLPDGTIVQGRTFLEASDLERQVNEHALDRLRNFSFAGLGILFVASLGIGWVIAGRVLRPIDRITSVARDIQGTNLSRRIELDGPDDELKRLADTFDAMLGRIDAAFAAQRRFVADASHELRNPLAVVQTNLDVALADPNASAASLRRAAQVARRATTRISRLAEDMLALARLEAPSVRREDVDLAAIAGEVADEHAAAASERDVTLERALPPGLFVVGDREGLKRALANLVENAVRHAPPGTAIRLGAAAEEPWAWLAVSDEGPGIAPEHQERIFDRFYRVDRARSRDEGGSGLGLAIVRELVEAHGGQARLHSEPGLGATFVVWLPLAAVREPAPVS